MSEAGLVHLALSGMVLFKTRGPLGLVVASLYPTFAQTKIQATDDI